MLTNQRTLVTMDVCWSGNDAPLVAVLVVVLAHGVQVAGLV